MGTDGRAGPLRTNGDCGRAGPLRGDCASESVVSSVDMGRVDL